MNQLREARTLSMRRGLARQLLLSPRLALLYAYEAVMRLQLLHEYTPNALSALASRCNVLARCDDQVSIIVTTGSKPRVVYKFSALKRMHQMLVRDVVRNLHPPRPEQYLLNGGVPEAIKAIGAAHQEGYTHAVEIDFVGFYGGVKHDGLAELLRPLPRGAVDHVIWDYTIPRAVSDQPAVSLCRDGPPLDRSTGLLLGSASSPIVGEVIIGHLLQAAREDRVVAYADNLLVLGRDEEEARASADNLAQVAERLEVGRSRPRIIRSGSFNPETVFEEPVHFLGQDVTINGDYLDWSPDEAKMVQHRTADLRKETTVEEIEATIRQVTSWRRSYSAWRSGDIWQAERIAELYAARYYRQALPHYFTDAVNALVTAYHTLECGRWLHELAPTAFNAEQETRRRRLIERSQAILGL